MIFVFLCLTYFTQYAKEEKGGGINWNTGIDIYTLLYVK